MKYLITYDDTYNIDYYCGFFSVMSRNILNMNVIMYNTRKNALKEIDKRSLDPLEYKIIEISEKDLFIARLKG